MISMEDMEELGNEDVLEDLDADEDGAGGGDDMDFSDLKPIDAFTMKMEDLVVEMERRHLHPKGFFNDDARELQKHFDQEHAAELEDLKQERRAQQQRSRMKARLQKKRLQLEKQLREEQDAVSADPRVEAWLYVVRQDRTRASARVEVDSVACRALAKALWNNTSLTALDLSRNDLSDFAGARAAHHLFLQEGFQNVRKLVEVRVLSHAASSGRVPEHLSEKIFESGTAQAGAQVGRMLKRNASLSKLELNENRLGPRTCRAFGDSLQTNGTLKALSLESNPLTNESTDQAGVVALARALASNQTLTRLNLWRCDVGGPAGSELAKALRQNSTLVDLDVGHNGILQTDQRKIADTIDANKAETKARARRERAYAEQLAKEEAGRQAIADAEQKQRDLDTFFAQQRDLRAAERMARADDERAVRKEEEAKRAEADRLAREAKKEEEAKKAKKGKSPAPASSENVPPSPPAGRRGRGGVSAEEPRRTARRSPPEATLLTSPSRAARALARSSVVRSDYPRGTRGVAATPSYRCGFHAEGKKKK